MLVCQSTVVLMAGLKICNGIGAGSNTSERIIQNLLVHSKSKDTG